MKQSRMWQSPPGGIPIEQELDKAKAKNAITSKEAGTIIIYRKADVHQPRSGCKKLPLIVTFSAYCYLLYQAYNAAYQYGNQNALCA